MGIVTDGGGELFGGPSGDFGGGGEATGVDGDNGGVGTAEFVEVFEGSGVDFFDHGQGVATTCGETGQFFEPGCAGGFEMQAGAEPRQGAADNGVERKFVAARMDAELQV